MAGLTHGMNPDEVERLGRELQRQADALEKTLAAIGKQVQGTPWLGADAERFKNQWWPEHQRKLAASARDLHGFGQSALNNASEQRRISNR